MCLWVKRNWCGSDFHSAESNLGLSVRRTAEGHGEELEDFEGREAGGRSESEVLGMLGCMPVAALAGSCEKASAGGAGDLVRGSWSVRSHKFLLKITPVLDVILASL